jgi:hypothetical protein
MIQFLRTLALILMILIGVSDPSTINFAILNPIWLYIISIAIFITLLFADSVTAFIFATTLVIAYIKIYDVKFPNLVKKQEARPIDLLDTVTNEKLYDVQSNIVDATAIDDYKGIAGVYGEEVYGAQGTVSELPMQYGPF